MQKETIYGKDNTLLFLTKALAQSTRYSKNIKWKLMPTLRTAMLKKETKLNKLSHNSVLR